MLVGRVRRTIEQRELIPLDSRVLCACSGGPDSAALLYCLAKLQPELRFELVAASVDHGLRPDAAADVALAAAQAQRLRVPFHALQVRVERGASMQARARRARYEALHSLAGRLDAQRIAVGHTQDDQAETVVSRVLRGTGMAGLGAIQPRREDGVIRPLLDCRRSEVHRLAAEKFDSLAQDLSNHDPKFERVRIRSQVMPVLLAEDAALVRHLSQLADDARDCALVIEALSETLFSQVAVDGHTLRASLLRGQPRALRVGVLRLFILRATGQVPGRAELTQLDRTLCSDRGDVWLASDVSVRASGDGHLLVCARDPHGGTGGTDGNTA
jgi:tRNA(Ile)-lysidine synthase